MLPDLLESSDFLVFALGVDNVDSASRFSGLCGAIVYSAQQESSLNVASVDWISRFIRPGLNVLNE